MFLSEFWDPRPSLNEVLTNSVLRIISSEAGQGLNPEQVIVVPGTGSRIKSERPRECTING